MKMPKALSEFNIISRYFAPLTDNFSGAKNLKDDAAIISAKPDYEIVVTCDAIVAGVHFRSEDSPEDIAARGLRVNLSDLAAMGAQPMGYLMALLVSPDLTEHWLERFVGQLAQDQRSYGIKLLGGDTVSAPGPLTLTITAIGQVLKGEALTRDGAKIGDRVFVSGNIGDACLGLSILRGEVANLSDPQSKKLVDRFLRPEPRITLGQSLFNVAHAVIDVSDGLISDVGHMCAFGNLGARIESGSIPLSTGALEALKYKPDMLGNLITSGDDYELAFTASPTAVPQLARISLETGVAVTDIGEIVSVPGVTLVGPSGEETQLAVEGYKHF